MPLVRFISANGETVQEVEARAGDCLLDVAQADRRLGEVSAGGAGDEAVPEQAYGFFHGVSDP